jgi:prepilin-type N-terminal cleavage/methylation domain-containing protein
MLRGFTLLEILIVISITLILALASFSFFGSSYTSAQLNESTTNIIQSLRLAQEKSIARLNNNQSGVYFIINPNGKDEYIVYQGQSYANRIEMYDQKNVLDDSLSLEVSGFTLTGTNVDINFSTATGVPNNIGTINLKNDSGTTKAIKINALGMVEE